MSTGRKSGNDTIWSTEDETLGLAEYIDENRDDLERLADNKYPVSILLQALLDRRDRGDI